MILKNRYLIVLRFNPKISPKYKLGKIYFTVSKNNSNISLCKRNFSK